MIDYQKVLDYYLNTDYYFWGIFYQFFDLFEHTGTCENDIHFVSMVYNQIDDRIKKEGGVRLILPPKIIKKCFSGNYDDSQIFAFVFSKWFGLSGTQIELILASENKEDCLLYLNYFILNRDESNKVDIEHLVRCRAQYYYLFVNNIKINAIRNEHCIINCVTKAQYLISD